MVRNFVKRYFTEDGSKRMTIYYDNDAENPRDMTDEPLHCEDWSRDYSIMNKQERESKSSDACELVRYLLERFGNSKEIIKVLKENHKSTEHFNGENCLMYDQMRHEWILFYWQECWQDYNGGWHGNQWCEEVSFCTKLKDLTAYDLASYLSEEQVEVFADHKYFTDGVKIASYGFGYYGSLSFDDTFSTASEGIAWLEKDEFLKYSGCKEEYWNGKSLQDIEFLCGELEAWADNEVYGFVVEDCIKSKVHKEYTNVDKEDEDYDEEEWEESDSCWGFYGELEKRLDDMIEYTDLKKEELVEE